MGSSVASTKSSVWSFIICGLAALFYLYDYFIQVSPSVMTNELMRDFNMGAGDLGALSACFYYSYTLMQIPAGMLLDRFGARKLLTFSVFISACGVVVFSQAHSFALLGLGRFVIGFGSSFAFISTLFLIARWFAHKYFGMIAGFVQLMGCIGSLIGLAPMALLVNHFGWRSAMLHIGIFTFVLAIIFIVVIDDGQPPAVDKTSQHQSEWQNLKMLLKNRRMWLIAVCGLISWVPVATIGALWGVPYLMHLYNVTNTQAGYICTLFWIGLGLGSPFMGWVMARTTHKSKTFSWCYLVGVIAAVMLVFAARLPLLVTALAVFCYGFSASAQSLSFALLKDNVPATLFGTASGFNNMAAILGGAISQPLVGYILHVVWNGARQNNIPVYSSHDYQLAFLILPIVAAIGYFVASKKLN